MSMIKRSMATIDGLGTLAGLNSDITNKTNLVAAINSVHTVAKLNSGGAAFEFVANKTTTFNAAAGAQVHVTDDGDGGWAVYRVTAEISGGTIADSSASLEKLMDQNALWNEFTAGQVTGIKTLLSNVTATTAVDLDALQSAVAANTAKVSNVTTNLSVSTTATAVTVESSDGTDATLSAASATEAGVLTAAQFTKLEGIAAGAQVNTVDSVAGKTGVVTLVKADVGLSNVDNTSDLAKPISTATQTALDAKAEATHNHAGVYEPVDATILRSAAIGVSVQAYAAGTVVDATYVHTDNNYVSADKAKVGFLTVTGAVNLDTLSSKVAGIESGAQVNTVTSVAGKTGAVTLTKADITDFNGADYQPANANTVVDANYAHITVSSNSVSDGTNTFTGKSYTIVTESLAVNGSGEITLTGAAVGNALLNFNTARHTVGSVSTDYTAAFVSGSTFSVDATLSGQAVTVQYLKLV